MAVCKKKSLHIDMAWHRTVKWEFVRACCNQMVLHLNVMKIYIQYMCPNKLLFKMLYNSKQNYSDENTGKTQIHRISLLSGRYTVRCRA